jgi:hypothetical protein
VAVLHPGRLEGEDEQSRTRVGQGRDSPTFGELLLGSQALEASDVEEEVERAQVARCQVRHVTDHEAGAAVAPSAGRVDGAWTKSMPTACHPLVASSQV